MAQPAHEFNELPDVFWAWLAGFVDGDGCIGLYGKPHKRPLVTVVQKERYILDVIVAKLGVGSVCVKNGKQHGGPYHGITWGSAASRTLCARLLPYLVTPMKRERAALCAAWKPIEKHNRKNATERNPGYLAAIEMYKAGASMPEIGARLGVSPTGVLKWLRRAGVASRSLREAQMMSRERRLDRELDTRED